MHLAYNPRLALHADDNEQLAEFSVQVVKNTRKQVDKVADDTGHNRAEAWESYLSYCLLACAADYDKTEDSKLRKAIRYEYHGYWQNYQEIAP